MIMGSNISDMLPVRVPAIVWSVRPGYMSTDVFSTVSLLSETSPAPQSYGSTSCCKCCAASFNSTTSQTHCQACPEQTARAYDVLIPFA